jgi:hypothetical protein
MEISLSTHDEFTATLDLHTSARHRPTDRYLIGLAGSLECRNLRRDTLRLLDLRSVR